MIQPYQRLDVPSPAYPWSAYTPQYAAIGTEDPKNVTVLSLTQRVDFTDRTFGLLNADNVHPTEKGHVFLSDAIAAFISAA